MLVDIQITAGVQIQIERAVPSDEFQHVIEKADSRADASFAATVQVQAERDIGLVGLTMNFCGSWHYSALSRIASCLGRCRFMRRQIFRSGENADVAGQPTKAFVANGLHAYAFHEICGG